MIRIAICDDEKKNVDRNEEIVKSNLQECGIGFEIWTYTRSVNLLNDIVDDTMFFDLLLLDIEMPEIDGMQISKKIKPLLPNIKIIFITSHVEYAIDAYELSIFRYIPKSDIDKRLGFAIVDASKLIELEFGKEYTIKTHNRLERISYKDIMYIYRDGKNSEIVSETGVSKVRKSLQQVYDELKTNEFIYIERGCIVNIIHIMKISDGMAVLKSGKMLPISRSHLQEVKSNITKFWGEYI